MWNKSGKGCHGSSVFWKVLWYCDALNYRYILMTVKRSLVRSRTMFLYRSLLQEKNVTHFLTFVSMFCYHVFTCLCLHFDKWKMFKLIQEIFKHVEKATLQYVSLNTQKWTLKLNVTNIPYSGYVCNRNLRLSVQCFFGLKFVLSVYIFVSFVFSRYVDRHCK